MAREPLRRTESAIGDKPWPDRRSYCRTEACSRVFIETEHAIVFGVPPLTAALLPISEDRKLTVTAWTRLLPRRGDRRKRTDTTTPGDLF
jgi:hypothetical protein